MVFNFSLTRPVSSTCNKSTFQVWHACASFFKGTGKFLAHSTKSKQWWIEVALSEQLSQKQQNNSVKHPETVPLLTCSLLWTVCLLCMKPTSPIEKLCMRMQHSWKVAYIFRLEAKKIVTASNFTIIQILHFYIQNVYISFENIRKRGCKETNIGKKEAIGS